VWKPNRAPKLIDSIYRGWPIGSLLLWSSTDHVRARGRSARSTHSGINWLIDGQQRVITLSRIMGGATALRVKFSPETREFRLANAALDRDERWFLLSDILDDDQYRHLKRSVPENRQDRYETAFEDVRRIRDYELPVVRMVDHSFEQAVEAFTRINTLGVKLKGEDIESARVAARHSGFIGDEVAPFLQSVRKDGLARLSVMHLFRACAFVAQPDGRARTPLHELPDRQVRSAWGKTQRAVQDVVGLMRSELGLLNMDILWTGSLLVPPIALLATQSNAKQRPTEIAAWMVAAGLFHRYSKASETALDQDLKACRADDPIRALLSNIKRDEMAINVLPSDFEGALVDRGGLLGLYVACRHKGAMDLFTGGKVTLQRDVHRHHILPRAQFPEQKRHQADCVANIALISAPTNRQISSSGPEVYLAKVSPRILESQCIPTDPQLWRIDKAADFWAARRELLAAAANEFFRKSFPNRKLM
jgi:hypothetical protein